MKTISQVSGLTLAVTLAVSVWADSDAPPRISGQVVDPAGAPVPRLQLSVFPFGPNPADLQTDDNGRFSFPWNPHRSGGQDAAFCLVARDVARNLAVAKDLDEGVTNLDLRLLPALVVAGRVQDSSGKPLANATLQASLLTGGMQSQFGGRVKPDAEGRFAITGLPPGRGYAIRASVKSLGSISQALEAEATLTNRIELPPFVFKLPDRMLAGQVLDEAEKPAAGLQVTLQGENQFFAAALTDEQGRFTFNAVCAGTVRVFASRQKAYASSTAEAGDTNVMLRLSERQTSSARPTPQRSSLERQPLPDLAAVGFAADAAPAGSPLLLCLFDIEQRPSRRFARLLAEQHGALRQKGIAVLGLQAAPIAPEAFKEWQDANPVPFVVGRVGDKSAATQWASQVESLPWLILTDKARRVVAEGFALDELEAKLPLLAQ